MVIKVAGMNGSGKTVLAREFLRRSGAVPLERAGSKVRAYRGQLDGRNLVVLGSYETECGGMDTINTQATKSLLVRKYARREDMLLFEGILTGVTYGEFGEFSETPAQKGSWLYVFMDTPFNVCVERVMARRLAKGNTTAFDPERSMRPKVKAFESVKRRASAAGHCVHLVDYRDTSRVAATKLLKKAVML